MQIMLVLQAEDLQHLPPALLDQLRSQLPATAAQQVQPQYQQQPQQPQPHYQQVPPPPYQPQQAPPPYQQQAPTGFAPAKVAVPGPNGVAVVAADRNHPSQMNGMKDVLTGQILPGMAVVPAGPTIPQFQGAPVSVGPVGAPAMVAPAQLVPQALTKAVVMQYAIKLRNTNAQALDLAVAGSGIVSLGNITDSNAGLFYQHMQHHSGGAV